MNLKYKIILFIIGIIIGCIITLLATIIYPTPAHSMEISPSIQMGTISSHQTDLSSANAHKIMIGIGVNIKIDKKYITEFEGTFWAMGEPGDRDEQVPSDGFTVELSKNHNFKVSKDLNFSPIVLVGIERWRRNTNKEHTLYGDLDFQKIGIGFKFNYNNFEFSKKMFKVVNNKVNYRDSLENGKQYQLKFTWKRDKISYGIFWNDSEFKNIDLERSGVVIQFLL